MKLWRVTFYDSDEGHFYEWFGTKAEAQRAASARGGSDESHEGFDPTIERMEIPNRKARLVRWLNVYVEHP